MMQITPQLIQVETFSVMGLKKRTKNAHEFNPQTAKLPALWQSVYSSPMLMQKPDSLIYGVYSDYESDDKGFYTVTAGIEANDLVAMDHFYTINIKKGNYFVFKNSGPMPKAIIDTWRAIWHYFDNQSNISRVYETDFEVYMGQEKCAVYIGVNVA